MAQRIWSGTVTFGLVTIPVTMVAAVRDPGPRSRLLHDEDHARLVRVMVCPEDRTPVPRERQVRGYEFEDDAFVVVTDEELASVAPERSRSIEIEKFVELEAIDPVYFDRPYYLVPEPGNERPYGLLVRVLEDTGRGGIARFVLRTREHLILVRPTGRALCLLTLHFDAAVRDPSGLVPESRLPRKDRQAMERAIEKKSGSFTPERYRDLDRERIESLIEKKRKQEGTVEVPEPEVEKEDTAGEPSELLEALQESLERARKGRRRSR